MDLTRVLDFLRVKIVYFGIIRDKYHADDHRVVQKELNGVKKDGMFVTCDRISKGEQVVFWFQRFKINLPESHWIFHRGDFVRQDRDLDDNSFVKGILDNKVLFPNCTRFEGVFEEREDFVEQLQKVIDYKGIVVGYIGYDTADRVDASDRDEIIKYITFVVSSKDEFAYFNRLDDHGCHGSMYYFILKKII